MNYDSNFLKSGIAGGLAGLSVDLISYPIQTIKTRIMASSIKQNLTKSASNISKFKGFSCQLIISFPYSFTFFLVYQWVKDSLPKSNLSNLIAATSSQMAANFLRNPLELVKQQMMVGRSDKIFTSLKQVYSASGIRGFYNGYSPTLIRDLLFSSIQMPIYQYLKVQYSRLLKRKQTEPFISSISGATAAFISAILTCPFDVIKTRHMTMRIKESEETKSTTLSIAKTIYSENGIKGFFKGVGFRAGLLTYGGIIYFYSLAYWKNVLNVV